MTRYEGVFLIPTYVIIILSKFALIIFNRIRNRSENDKNESKSHQIYDKFSNKTVISLLLKCVSVIAVSVFYVWIFNNFAEKPFSFEDYVYHLTFPYQIEYEKSKSKKQKDDLITYPFKNLINNIGTINKLRQAHTNFDLFLPILFVAFLLITTKSSNDEDMHKSSVEFNESSEKADDKKKQSKSEINQKNSKNEITHRQNQASKSNTKVSKNSKPQKLSVNCDQDQLLYYNQIHNLYQNQSQAIAYSMSNSFSTYYQEVTADFLRQIGLLVLVFTLAASCIPNGAVFRVLAIPQAFAYIIVSERLLKRFLQLLFSTSLLLEFQKQRNEIDEDENERKKLELSAFSEKVIFFFGSLIFLICLITWDCFYSRREIHRYNFPANLWYNFAVK